MILVEVGSTSPPESHGGESPTLYYHSLSRTYLPILHRIPIVWGEHHSHNFPDGSPDRRLHRRASTPSYYNDRLSGFRIGWWEFEGRKMF